MLKSKKNLHSSTPLKEYECVSVQWLVISDRPSFALISTFNETSEKTKQEHVFMIPDTRQPLSLKKIKKHFWATKNQANKKLIDLRNSVVESVNVLGSWVTTHLSRR